MALLSRLYMDCCNCTSQLALASAVVGKSKCRSGYGLRGNKFSPVNPVIPVLSVVKIFQESKDIQESKDQKSREWPKFPRMCGGLNHCTCAIPILFTPLQAR